MRYNSAPSQRINRAYVALPPLGYRRRVSRLAATSPSAGGCRGGDAVLDDSRCVDDEVEIEEDMEIHPCVFWSVLKCTLAEKVIAGGVFHSTSHIREHPSRSRRAWLVFCCPTKSNKVCLRELSKDASRSIGIDADDFESSRRSVHETFADRRTSASIRDRDGALASTIEDALIQLGLAPPKNQPVGGVPPIKERLKIIPGSPQPMDHQPDFLPM